MITFAVVEKDGRTPSENPKLDAYKYAAMLVNVQGRRYTMIAHLDGSFEVQSDGLMPMRFTKIEEGTADE